MKRLDPCRLSNSIIWDLQRRAYTQFGIGSWTQKGVPFHRTNNSLIAKQYAEIAFPFCKKGPVTFLELGAGSGKFAYLFLSELFQLGVSEASVRYLLTDFSEKNVAFWCNHPLFIPLIEKGIVHPIVYDPLASQSLLFPFDFVVANYFFDTIPQDLFLKEKGQLFEGLVSVSVEEGEDLEDPNLISSLSLDYSYCPIEENLPYFDLPELDKFLTLYCKKEQTGPFLFPSGGFKALLNLSASCKTPFTLLMSDWCNREDESPLIHLHGTFSFPVDLQAIALFFLSKEGEACLLNESYSRFQVGLFYSGKILEESRHNFKSQDFKELEIQGSSMEELLNYLRDSNWDATLFFSCFDIIEKLFDSATEEEKSLFLEGCLKIPSHFYPLFKEETFFLDRVGIFLENLHLKKEAEKFFQTSQLFTGLPNRVCYESHISVLQIGEAPLGMAPLAENITIVPLSLSALQSLATFDVIFLFPQSIERSDSPKISLFQEIEQKFPHLNQMVYTDQALYEFLSQLDCISPKYLIQFVLGLERRKQITSKQLELIFDHLQERGLISLKDREQLGLSAQPVDYFDILLCALKYHMRKGGMLKGLFSASFKDERFFNEVTVDPYLDCKEEIGSSSTGEKFLWVTIKKFGS